eukprot:s1518_g11.t1
MKWSHHVVAKKNFVSEWQAVTDALDEAFAVGYAEPHLPVPCECFDGPKVARCNKSCSFDDNVQVCFSLEDEIQGVSVTLKHEFLHRWESKPWSLRSTRMALLQADPLSFSAVSISEQVRPFQVRHTGLADSTSIFFHSVPDEFPELNPDFWAANPAMLPDWWLSLRDLHGRFGSTECLEEGKIIYVCSWYLHGQHLRSSQHSRALKFDSNWAEWLDIIQETWRDQLFQDVPVDIGLIVPNPPSSVFQGHVAHLVLGQQLHDEPVGIVSGYFRNTRRDVIAQTAQILPAQLTYDEAIDLVPARVQCNFRQCHASLGDQSLQGVQAWPTPHFTSLVVEVFPMDEDVDDFSSFMAAGGRNRRQPDQGSLAERRDIARQEDDPAEADQDLNGPEDSSSESESEEGAWHNAVVFSVHWPPALGNVNWQNPQLLRQHVARIAQFEVDQLRAAHHVPHPPADIRDAGRHMYLAHHVEDVPQDSRLAFVLFDVEFHPPAPSWQVERVRGPLFVPTVLSRHQLLRVMDVFRYAQFVQDTCLVWLNGELVQQDTGHYVRLRHGDYVRIALPPPLTEISQVPTRCVARLLQMGVEPENLEALYWVSDVDNDLDPMPTHYRVVEDVNSSDSASSSDSTSILQLQFQLRHRGRLVTHHDGTDFAALRRQYCATSETTWQGLHGGVPLQELPWFERDLLPQWQNAAQDAPGGLERMARVLTWFNDHHRYPLCADPREVALFDDVLEWRALMTRAWMDLITDEQQLHFFIVIPTPLFDDERICAHVLLVQDPHADFKSVLVSIFDDAIASGTPRRWALMLPNTLHRQQLIDIMGYGSFCLPRSLGATCSLWHGDQEVLDQGVFVTTHGMSLALMVQRLPLAGAQSSSVEAQETMSLLQTKTIRRKISLEQLVHDDHPLPSTYVKLVPGVSFLQLPDFVEVAEAFDQRTIEEEVRQWGEDCVCAVFPQAHVAVCYPAALPAAARPSIWLYQKIGSMSAVDLIVDKDNLATTSLEHMRFLYKHGFWRAHVKEVLSSSNDARFPVTLIRFFNNTVQIAPMTPNPSCTTWPSPLPTRDTVKPLFDSVALRPLESTCSMDFGMGIHELDEFFVSANDILSQSFEGVELPDHIVAALASCQPLQKIDRLLIYCDGSSLPDQRRAPPLRAEERGQGDTWAFLVLAEEYTLDEEPRINFVGWTAQPVLFASDAQHHIGSSTIGSETSEREALFWSALWRLAQNHDLPTTFCNDSVTAEKQGAGLHGTVEATTSFRLLRSSFQALESALGKDYVQMSHVQGHSGNAWNDLVHLLAKQERTRSFYHCRQKIDLRSWQLPLQFMWMVLARDDSLPRFQGSSFDIAPPDLPCELPPVPDAGFDQWQTFDLHISFSTCNVGSLYTGAHGGRGKVQFLREQMQAHGFNFMGVQETRCPGICSLVDNVYRLGAGAEKGHWGVELWVNLRQPIAHHQEKPVLLRQRDIVVLHASPRLLIVRVDHPVWSATIIVAHAPQSGQSLTDRQSWWAHLTEQMQAFLDDSPTFLLIDANAAPGEFDGCVVGSDAFPVSRSTGMFRDLLATFDLCLPSTFPCHQGSTTTWISPTGSGEHTIDFVCVPRSLLSSCTLSTVVADFDVCNGDHDHLLVALQMAWQATVLWRPDLPADRPIANALVTRENLSKPISDLQAPAWSTDIATHYEVYNAHLHQCLGRHCAKPRGAPKKSIFTDDLWKLRTLKLAAKRRLGSVGRRQRSELLRFVFQAWCDSRVRATVPDALLEYGSDFFNYGHTLLCWRLSCTAQLYAIASQLKFKLQRARRQALADELQALDSNASACDILRTIRTIHGPTNLKHIKRKTLPMLLEEDGTECLHPAQLLGRWISFFGEMEGGTRMDQSRQWHLWRTNLERFRQSSLSLTVGDVPTLTDLEQAFRRVPRNKACGPDKLPSALCSACAPELARQNYGALLKLVLHGQESLCHKGGVLTPAHKGKGPHNDPSAYRSLLVSSFIGKTLHRTLRQTQATLLEKFMTRSQLGGKRRVPVSLGLHEARSYLRTAIQSGRSAILIMVDLTEAFYRVLRPLAIGSEFSDQEIAKVAAKLRLPVDTLCELYSFLADESAIQMAGMAPHYQRAIQAVHADTFFQMPGQWDVCRTTIGSRPGDSFADSVFTFLFSRVLSCFQDKIEEMDLHETLCPVPDFDPYRQPTFVTDEQQVYTGPVWMDDLCVTVSADTPATALQKACTLTSVLMEVLESHGMTPNLRRGKTEMLASFRGQGVRAIKARLFGPLSSGTIPVICEHETKEVSIVGEYQHLGGLLHHSGDHRKEMKRRVAMAHQTMTAHRRTIFQHPDIPLPKRVQLFQTLVLSRLLYGCESWHLQDQRSQKFFHAAVIRLYKRLLRLAPDCHWTDEEVCVHADLPLPAELLRRARLRYIGTLHRCEDTLLWTIFHRDDAWCALIRDDLHWMWTQLRHSSSLLDPSQHLSSWRYLWRFHGNFWKGLVKRAFLHAGLQRQNELTVRLAHKAILDDLVHGKVIEVDSMDDVVYQLPETPTKFGCMACQRQFKSRAGEGAHMFRCHHEVSPLRWLFDTTACPSCLREYHSYARLKAHLGTATQCRQRLLQRPPLMEIAAGAGSTVNAQQDLRTNGLLPPLPGHGPRLPDEECREIEILDLDLYAEITEVLIATPCQHHQSALRDCICLKAVSWTTCRRVLMAARNNATEEDATAFGYLRLVDLHDLLDLLADPLSWPFLQETLVEQRIPELGDLERMTDAAHVLQDQPCPRAFGVHRFVLHLYSGRRRPGDFQEFLEAMVSGHDGVTVHVVSVDIVLSSEWGDVTSERCQKFWFDAVKRRFVLGFLAGPPCETWSQARETPADDPLQPSAATGPRVLRTLEEIWGLSSMAVREVRQVLTGNQLLLFAFRLMVQLFLVGGCGAIEHPGLPLRDESASIWKTFLALLLSRLPGIQRIDFSQGLLGAKSHKPTSILALNLPQLAVHIWQGRLCADPPKTASIGKDSSGGWKTTSLKEYSPALCRALAAGFADFVTQILDAHRERQLQQQVLTAFNKEMEPIPEPRLVMESRGFGAAPMASKLASCRGFKPPNRRVSGAPLQNNFVASERLRGAGAGNYGWAAQRLSRATALAAVHWQNPRAYRAQLHGCRDPEDVREEELQIQVLGKMGGESLEESLRETACRQTAQQFIEAQRKQEAAKEGPGGGQHPGHHLVVNKDIAERLLCSEAG